MMNHDFTADVLNAAQSKRKLIQDYRPFAESIEWQLGQQYFRERGNKAFIHDNTPVPFVVNNDGFLSSNAAGGTEWELNGN